VFTLFGWLGTAASYPFVKERGRLRPGPIRRDTAMAQILTMIDGSTVALSLSGSAVRIKKQKELSQ